MIAQRHAFLPSREMNIRIAGARIIQHGPVTHHNLAARPRHSQEIFHVLFNRHPPDIKRDRACKVAEQRTGAWIKLVLPNAACHGHHVVLKPFGAQCFFKAWRRDQHGSRLRMKTPQAAIRQRPDDGRQNGRDLANPRGDVIRKLCVIRGGKRNGPSEAVSPCGAAQGPFRGDVNAVRRQAVDHPRQPPPGKKGKPDVRVGGQRHGKRKITWADHGHLVTLTRQSVGQMLISADDAVHLRQPRIADNQDFHDDLLGLAHAFPYDCQNKRSYKMKHLLSILCAILLSGPAHAQDPTSAPEREKQDKPLEVDKKALCENVREIIIPLRAPVFGGAVLWRKVLGVDGEDRFSDLQPLPDNGAVLIGETHPYDLAKKISGDSQIYLATLDKTGKVVGEYRTPKKDLRDVVAGTVLGSRVTVLNGQATDAGMASRVSFYDVGGKLISEKTYSSKKYDFYPRDITADHKNNGYIMAVWAVNRGTRADNFTIMFRLDAEGRVIWQRQYLPGVPNKIETISLNGNGQILAAGRTRGDNDRESGWILKTSADGNIINQQIYPRGYQALLRKVLEKPDGSMIVIGDALPSSGGFRAGWVMALDQNDAPVWQRFITGKYSYASMDSIIYPDGRIVVLVAARPGQETGGREHARLLTFSNEGLLLNDEAYIEKSNSLGLRMMPVENGRLIVGMAQSGFAEAGLPENMRLNTYDAWVASLQRIPPYDDPCKKQSSEDLDNAIP